MTVASTPFGAHLRRAAAGTYEIPVLHRTRLQARGQRRWDLVLALVVLAVGGALALGTAAWLRPVAPVQAPVVRVTQPVAPIGGFAVDAASMGPALRASVRAALPPDVRATASFLAVTSSARVEGGAGDVPLAVRAGHLVLDVPAGRADVSVEVSRTPRRPPCSAPCVTTAEASTTAYRAEGVRVTVRVGPDAAAARALGLGPTTRARIAADPQWVA